jgi:hypothetical protein
MSRIIAFFIESCNNQKPVTKSYLRQMIGINIREVVEEALESAIRDKEKEELKKIVMKIKELMRDVSEEDWVRAVRESRDER